MAQVQVTANVTVTAPVTTTTPTPAPAAAYDDVLNAISAFAQQQQGQVDWSSLRVEVFPG